MIAGLAVPLWRGARAILARAISHPGRAALLAAAVWLCWLQLVTLPDKDATIAAAEATIVARTVERDEEGRAHRATKKAYATAQLVARELEEKRLTRVAAEQQEITDAVTENFRRRLADALAAAERLRGQTVRAPERAAGAAGGLDLSGAGGGTVGTAAPAGDREFSREERLIATEQAIQLDELINWVVAQGLVEPNRDQEP